MGADVSTLVTLDTVFFKPFGNECCNTTFFVSGSALFPCAIFATNEVGYFQVVAGLGVDRTDYIVDECRIVVLYGCILGEVAPCFVDGELLVFATAVNSCVVLVNHILTLLAVALDDEFLHLLNGEINGDHFGDAEECALENGVGAVSEADFLSDLGSIDIVDGDVMVCEVFLHLVWQVLGQFLAFPDGVEKECSAVAKATGHVVHVEVSLNVASNEVRSGHQIG